MTRDVTPIINWTPKTSTAEVLQALEKIISILERLSPAERKTVYRALAVFGGLT